MFPISSSALSDWIGSATPNIYTGSNLAARFDLTGISPLSQFAREGNSDYILSHGTAMSTGDLWSAYTSTSSPWQPIALFGLPRSKPITQLARSDNTSDNRIWLINQGQRQHIMSGAVYNTFSINNTVPVTVLPQSVLDALPQINAGQDPSRIVYADGQGPKLLDGNGRFYGFPDGNTFINYANNNPILKMSVGEYFGYWQYAGNISQLVRDPSGKVYWIQNGQKKWIVSPSIFQNYAGSASLINLDWSIINWIPDGTPITN
jgi:hypothetical protein